MRVVIAGSRSIKYYDQVLCAIINSGYDITEVVSGAAPGIDRLGERYADENGIPCARFPANWDLYGKKAGPTRNAQMAAYCDAAIVVWDGKSKGSYNMIQQMNRFKKPYFVWKVNVNGTTTSF